MPSTAPQVSADAAETSAAPRPLLARPTPTGRERRLGDNELIVSKTDLAGRITYCNRVFVRLAGYSEAELLGAPHSIVRHPDMPRCVFQLLWDTLKSGREIFAYVVNLSRNGEHYWVLAHVTPSFDEKGAIVGYHSNRRAPERAAVEAASALYRELLSEERKHSGPREAVAASTKLLMSTLQRAGLTYDQWVFALSEKQS